MSIRDTKAFYLIVLFLCLSFCSKSHEQKGSFASIELVSPNGGETWAAESKHYITWKTDQIGDSNTLK